MISCTFRTNVGVTPWWNVPCVLVVPCPFQDQEEGFATWWKAWPSGLRHDTYCLDGGANNRPTAWGKFATLAEAIQSRLKLYEANTPFHEKL